MKTFLDNCSDSDDFRLAVKRTRHKTINELKMLRLLCKRNASGLLKQRKATLEGTSNKCMQLMTNITLVMSAEAARLGVRIPAATDLSRVLGNNHYISECLVAR